VLANAGASIVTVESPELHAELVAGGINAQVRSIVEFEAYFLALTIDWLSSCSRTR
jgi:hypothetical protein